jgi:hypothetical protein
MILILFCPFWDVFDIYLDVFVVFGALIDVGICNSLLNLKLGVCSGGDVATLADSNFALIGFHLFFAVLIVLMLRRSIMAYLSDFVVMLIAHDFSSSFEICSKFVILLKFHIREVQRLLKALPVISRHEGKAWRCLFLQLFFLFQSNFNGVARLWSIDSCYWVLI